MKKLLIFLFSILISFNSYGLFEKTVCVETDAQKRDNIIYLLNETKPFTGKNLCKYENGLKRSEGNFKDGKKDGKWTEWYENGQKKSGGYYKDGKKHGKYTVWYENGQKEAEVNYKDGKEDGKWTKWHKNGKKKWNCWGLC